jgi:uncharacterized protein
MTGKFKDAMKAAYELQEPAIVLGCPIDGAEVLSGVQVAVALSMLNRHGLIAGATGTGKTKTLQLIAGQLSEAGVPCLVADVKGDLTGMAEPADAANPKVKARLDDLGLPFEPRGHPVEFLSLTGNLGARIRASVHSFGPLLLSRVLDLNDTQASVLSLVFKYCDDNGLALLDLADLTTTLKYLASDDGKASLADYGGAAPATLGVIARSIVNLQQQGADDFFGEPEFEVGDLLRTDAKGAGILSVLELSDVMDRPALLGTFMLWLLAQLYHELPEMGDLPKPKLCFFFDEAHYLFENASKALLDQIELTVRLIRSKGVGVFFITQTPTDVPSSVLAQLGNRVQHALRVFTPEDADNLKKTVRTFPMTSYFDVGERLTSLGIGEALVTVLSPNGVPTALAPTRMLPPNSSMTPLAAADLGGRIKSGELFEKYAETVDSRSAHELIGERIAAARSASATPTPGAAGRQVSGGLDTPPVVVFDDAVTYAADRERRVAGVFARQDRAMEKIAQAEARKAEAARKAQERAQERAQLQHEREIAQIGNTVLRGVFGVLRGSTRRRR